VRGLNATSLLFHCTLAFSASAISYVEVLSKRSVDWIHVVLRVFLVLLSLLSLTSSLVLYLVLTNGGNLENVSVLDNVILLANVVILLHLITYHRYHKGYRKTHYLKHRSPEDVLFETKMRVSSIDRPHMPLRRKRSGPLEPDLPTSEIPSTLSGQGVDHDLPKDTH